MSIYWKKKNRGSVSESWEVNSQCSLKFCCALVSSSLKQRIVTVFCYYSTCLVWLLWGFMMYRHKLHVCMSMKWLHIWKYWEWCLLFTVPPWGLPHSEHPARSSQLTLLYQTLPHTGFKGLTSFSHSIQKTRDFKSGSMGVWLVSLCGT